jgi:hypothetical protein
MEGTIGLKIHMATIIRGAQETMGKDTITNEGTERTNMVKETTTTGEMTDGNIGIGSMTNQATGIRW